MNLFAKTSIAAVIAAILATPVAANCLNFFQHVPAGPYHGGVYNLDANTQIVVKPTFFWGPPGAPAPNFGRVDMIKNTCFGGPATLQINNANCDPHHPAGAQRQGGELQLLRPRRL